MDNLYKVVLTAGGFNEVISLFVTATDKHEAEKIGVAKVEKAYPIYKGTLEVYNIYEIEEEA